MKKQVAHDAMRIMAAGVACIFVAVGCVPQGTSYCDAEQARHAYAIPGVAAGGTLSLGQYGRPELLTINTAAGDTSAAIVQKLIARHLEDPESSPLPHPIATSDGQALSLGGLPGEVYLRTTDTGIQAVAAVSNLRAVSSKSQSKVNLTWTAPSPAPDNILIRRYPSRIFRLSGTATSLEDVYDPAKPRGGHRRTYKIICMETTTTRTTTSDMIEITTEHPLQMKSDTFRITTTQEWIRNGTVGSAYRQIVYKEGGTNPVSWSLDSGTLPDGLALTTVNRGVDAFVSGTPIATGTSEFALKVTDATGATTTKDFSITVTNIPVMDFESPPSPR